MLFILVLVLGAARLHLALIECPPPIARSFVWHGTNLAFAHQLTFSIVYAQILASGFALGQQAALQTHQVVDHLAERRADSVQSDGRLRVRSTKQRHGVVPRKAIGQVERSLLAHADREETIQDAVLRLHRFRLLQLIRRVVRECLHVVLLFIFAPTPTLVLPVLRRPALLFLCPAFPWVLCVFVFKLFFECLRLFEGAHQAQRCLHGIRRIIATPFVVRVIKASKHGGSFRCRIIVPVRIRGIFVAHGDLLWVI
mmetsp:Transcript_52391/g.131678  ORF Transcript_52391/g.131678 Transcript_52391/m.131678 type:complete len:255 (+) Transcript_52391:611-1375(+)